MDPFGGRDGPSAGKGASSSGGFADDSALAALFRQFIESTRGEQSLSETALRGAPAAVLPPSMRLAPEERAKVRNRSEVMARQFFPDASSEAVDAHIQNFMRALHISDTDGGGGAGASSSAGPSSSGVFVPPARGAASSSGVVDAARSQLEDADDDWKIDEEWGEDDDEAAFQEELDRYVYPPVTRDAPAPYEFLFDDGAVAAAIDDAGGDEAALVSRGIDEFSAGRYEQAALHLEAAVRVNERNSQAWRMLGAVHAETDDDFRAHAALHTAVEIDPMNLDALFELGVSSVNQLQNPTALRYLRLWFERHPEYSALAQSLTSSGSTVPALRDELMQLTERCLEINDNDADLYNLLGVLCNASRDFDRALSSFRRAVELDPQNYILWNRLGVTQTNGFSSSDAVFSYRRSLQLKSGYCRGWANLGIAFVSQKMYKDAAKCFMKALQMYSRSTHLWMYLSLAFNNMRRWDLVDAISKMDVSVFASMDLDKPPADEPPHDPR